MHRIAFDMPLPSVHQIDLYITHPAVSNILPANVEGATMQRDSKTSSQCGGLQRTKSLNRVVYFGAIRTSTSTIVAVSMISNSGRSQSVFLAVQKVHESQMDATIYTNKILHTVYLLHLSNLPYGRRYICS